MREVERIHRIAAAAAASPYHPQYIETLRDIEKEAEKGAFGTIVTLSKDHVRQGVADILKNEGFNTVLMGKDKLIIRWLQL